MGRRKPLQTTEYTVSDAVENLASVAGELRDELQEWYDNLPESFQSGSKGDQLQEAIDALDEVAESSIDVPEGVADLSFTYSFRARSGWISRRDRMEEAASIAELAKSRLEEFVDEQDDDDDNDAQTLIDELDSAIDSAQNVEFPGMYS